MPFLEAPENAHDRNELPPSSDVVPGKRLNSTNPVPKPVSAIAKQTTLITCST